jgi:phage-related minor tail protein
MHNINFNFKPLQVTVMLLALASIFTLVLTNLNAYALGSDVLVDTFEVMDTTNEMQVMVLEEQIINDAAVGMGMSNGLSNWSASQVMSLATTVEPTITTGMKNSKGIFSKLKKALKSIAKFVVKVFNVIKKVINILNRSCRVISIVENGMDSKTVCGVFVPRGNPIP